MIVMSWFELVQTLIQTIPFPMDIVDEKGNILFQNDVFKEMFDEDVIGKKCWDLYVDDKKQCQTCPLHEEINIGESKSHVSYGVLGGKIYDIHHTGMMFNGKRAILEIFMDITDRREMMDELQRSEEQFRQLFGNMEQGFAVHKMIFDDDGKPIDYQYIMVNEAFKKLTGLQGVNVIGKTIKQIVPTIEDHWIKEFGEVVTSGKPKQFENHFGLIDKIFNVTAYSPKKGFFAVVFYDVTKYKEDEKKLADKQKFIESILNVCPSVIYVYDIEKRKNIYINNSVETIYGYTSDEIKSLDDLHKDLMHPKDYDIYINETLPKYQKLKNKTLKHSFRMKDKKGKWIRLLATEVIYKTDENGIPTQIVGNVIKE